MAPADCLWTETGKSCRSGDGTPRVGNSSRVHLAHGTVPSVLGETTPTQKVSAESLVCVKTQGPMLGLEEEEHPREDEEQGGL